MPEIDVILSESSDPETIMVMGGELTVGPLTRSLWAHQALRRCSGRLGLHIKMMMEEDGR